MSSDALLRTLRTAIADRHLCQPTWIRGPLTPIQRPDAWPRVRALLRDAGFVCVDATSRRAECAEAWFLRRHIAILVRRRRDRCWARRLVAGLARASPRAHLVIDLAGGGKSMPPMVTSLPATGVVLSRRTDMTVDPTLPALLQLVQDAEDDQDALTGLCAWMCRSAGAAACAVAATSGHLIARDGCTAADWAAHVPLDLVRAGVRRRIVNDGYALVLHPIRQAGTTIGMLVVRHADRNDERWEECVGTAAALCGPALRGRLDVLAMTDRADRLAPEILGRSPAIAALRQAIARAAATPFPVLIQGESGTGKELVARAVHRLSARRDRRFAAVNCAALSDELVEAELFGHARGAFTGAIGAREGLFEDASSGTLFLDEVGELSPRAQAKLLRVLQEREIRRVGENHSRRVDVRVVAATNRDLRDRVDQGMFREDLLFRLAVIRIRLPPLRDRVEDIPSLALAFWKPAAAAATTHAALGADAVMALCRHGWPGNVRELQNVMAAIAVAAPARGRVTARHVSFVLGGDHAANAAARSLGLARQTFERSAVAAALARHGGRRTAAARELGLSRQGLTKAIKRLGLVPDADARGVA